MTPEQKRGHLALHGFQACTLQSLTAADTVDFAWRLYVPGDAAQRNLSKMGANLTWRVGRMASNTSLYQARELSEVPDELLDQLDISLIERLCNNPFDPSL